MTKRRPHHIRALSRRTIACLLALTTVLSMVIPATAASSITSPSAVSGSQYTQVSTLAEALDRVFGGDIDIYSNSSYTNEVSMPLGHVMDNDTQYYVQSKTSGNGISGWQCYIYANAVYNKLFNEWVGHGSSFAHSKVVISGGVSSLSYEDLRNAKVRCGAYVRTTANSSGAYDGSSGHSFLILAYDADGITYLEGNADGKGLVRITTRDWADFNSNQLSGRSRYLSHIVQPTDTYYDELYVPCDHVYGDLGICDICGTAYDWEGTLDKGYLGIYQVTVSVTPRADRPYEAATKADVTLSAGQEVQVLGRLCNAHGQYWYALRQQDQTLYVPEGDLSFLRAITLEVTVRDFVPADQAVLAPKSQPVKGAVTSNYPLKSVRGYLDGKLYATWNASDETTTQLELQATDINYDLTFSALADGEHTIRLEAESFLHEDRMAFHESVFYIQSTCDHSYTSSVTKEASCTAAGTRTYSCTQCGDSYTEQIPALGHDYSASGKCTRCGASQTALDAPQIQYCYSQQRTSMRVQWTAVAEADGYQLYRSSSPNDSSSWKCVKTINSGSTLTYTNQNLTEGVTYYYKVRAFRDMDGSRVYSQFSDAKFMPAAVVFDSPYSNSDSRIRLRWDQVEGAHGYQIWRKDDDGTYRVIKTIGDKGNELTNDQGHVTAYSNTGLESDKTYTYKMRAFYITPEGDKSFGTFSREVTLAVQPATTTLSVAANSDGSVRLRWDAAKGADGYQIWMSESASSSSFQITKSITDGDVTAYTKNHLQSGKTYYFKIRAYVEVDGKKTFGAYSGTISITVK